MPPSVTALQISQPPVIDGKGDDPCWFSAATGKLAATTSDGDLVEFTIKAAVDDENIYLLVAYPDSSESRRPAFWTWNADRSIYTQTAGDEDGLAIFLYDAETPDRGDLWIWRASRTDPDGYADDLSFKTATISPGGRMLFDDVSSLAIKNDSGTSCWKSRFYGAYVGNNLPRFQREPQPVGSAADVVAKGHWEAGVWTVELARRLTTGNPDDLDLSNVTTAMLVVKRSGDGVAAEEDTNLAVGRLILPRQK